MKNYKYTLAFLLVAIIVAGFLFYIQQKYHFLSQNTDQAIESLPLKRCDSLELQINESEEVATIFCIQGNNKEEIHKLDDMNISHYHQYEENGGNLYLTRRIGYDGYPDDTWTDELWVYSPDGQSKKLISDKGLDFRVSPDGKMIAVVTNELFRILDASGTLIKTFEYSDVIANLKHSPMFNFYEWTEDSIWLSNTYGPALGGLIKIDRKTFEVTKYDLSSVGIGPEYSFNLESGKLAYSNYPAIFDEYGGQNFIASKAKVTLWVYDINTKEKQTITSSITKQFYPTWLDKNTLEFDSPIGDSRVTKKL